MKLLDAEAKVCDYVGAGMAFAIPYQARAVRGSESMETPTDPTSVYRYYDEHGVLLYVGITKTGINRNRQHNDDKEWWKWVASQKVDHFDSREQAHAREVDLIQRFRPPFNRQHNCEYADVRAAYLAAQEIGFDIAFVKSGLPKELRNFTLDVAERMGHRVILRTRPEHTVAMASVLHVDGVPVFARIHAVGSHGPKIGTVVDIERVGPLTRIHAYVNKGWQFDRVHVWLRPASVKGGGYVMKRLEALDCKTVQWSESS